MSAIEVTAMYLKEYLESKKDSNECLFAHPRGNHEHLGGNGGRSYAEKLRLQAHVSNVHPHRYRRTLATNLLDRGANIQDVAAILGHEDIKTTQIYCYTDQNNVRNAHRKFIA